MLLRRAALLRSLLSSAEAQRRWATSAAAQAQSAAYPRKRNTEETEQRMAVLTQRMDAARAKGYDEPLTPQKETRKKHERNTKCTRNAHEMHTVHSTQSIDSSHSLSVCLFYKACGRGSRGTDAAD